MTGDKALTTAPSTVSLSLSRPSLPPAAVVAVEALSEAPSRGQHRTILMATPAAGATATQPDGRSGRNRPRARQRAAPAHFRRPAAAGNSRESVGDRAVEDAVVPGLQASRERVRIRRGGKGRPRKRAPRRRRLRRRGDRGVAHGILLQ